MKRPAAQEKTLDRIRRWREICPDLAIRSTFIVGFPGETEADFEFMLQWLGEAQLDRVGCFRYEPVEGAAANALGPHVPPEVTEERWHRFMAAQQTISAARLRQKIGRTVEVLIDQSGPGGTVGRSYADAPDIDGVVHIATKRRPLPGTIVPVTITGADEYDLFATL
jgi:ribosomal protein S12 methylthiotransferase